MDGDEPVALTAFKVSDGMESRGMRRGALLLGRGRRFLFRGRWQTLRAAMQLIGLSLCLMQSLNWFSQSSRHFFESVICSAGSAPEATSGVPEAISFRAERKRT